MIANSLLIHQNRAASILAQRPYWDSLFSFYVLEKYQNNSYFQVIYVNLALYQENFLIFGASNEDRQQKPRR